VNQLLQDIHSKVQVLTKITVGLIREGKKNEEWGQLRGKCGLSVNESVTQCGYSLLRRELFKKFRRRGGKGNRFGVKMRAKER